MCCKCDNTGWRYIEVSDGPYSFVEQHYCDCIAGLRARYPGIPDEALGWTFENFPGDPAARDKARAALDDGRWAVLLGPVGTGKTSLAASACKVQRDRGVQARFWNVALLLDATKATFGREDLINPIERLYTTCPFLVLDGLGERRLTEWERGAIEQLLGQRYTRRQELRTWITTNLDMGELGCILSMWTLDRLRDVAVLIPMDGRSMRGRT